MVSTCLQRPAGLRPAAAAAVRAARPRCLCPLRPGAAPRRAPPPARGATPIDSTDLDVEARDPRDVGVYVYDGPAALHVGFQGPGWTLSRDPDTGYVFSLVDYCSPGRVRLAFGAAVGQDSDDEVVYDWGRRGWGGGGHCLGNSLGDEKPRFYLSARQAAAILAAPNREHKFDFHFVGWRGDEDGCPLQNEDDREAGIAMTKSLTWKPLPPAAGANGAANGADGGDHKYDLTLSLLCSDGFAARTRVRLDAADYVMFEECVRFAIPHLLGLHGAFRLPTREDYAQDRIL